MKYCEGCCSREPGCVVMIHIEYTIEKKGVMLNECPCSICLIKVVCRSACEDYLSFGIGEPVTGSINRFK